MASPVSGHMSIINFDQGTELTDRQLATLGEKRVDEFGNIWEHVQFHESGIKPGHLVRTTTHTDEIGAVGTAGNVSVTAAADVGTRLLKATGLFNEKSLRGAIGNIYDGAGEGQNFRVDRVVDKDTLEITLLSKATGMPDQNNPGWAVALATSSRFRLMMPGLVMQGDATLTGEVPIIEGVSRVEITDDNKDQYGWVQQTGLCPVLFDQSVGVPTPGNLVVPTAGGLATVAPTVTLTGAMATVASVIGRAYTGVLANNDSMAMVELAIGPTARSFRSDTRSHPFKNFQRETGN